MSNEMQKLAEEVAACLAMPDWQDDLITREIGTAHDRVEALRRLATVTVDVGRAVGIVSEKLTAYDALLTCVREFESAFREGVEQDLPINGGDAVEWISQHWPMFRDALAKVRP